MRIRIIALLALVLTLPACGLLDRTELDPKTTATEQPVMDGALPQVADGKPAPAALTDVTCSRDDDDGTWTASGAVSNDTKKPVTYQVTVHVGPADGQGAPASTKRINAVQPNGSVGFDLGEIEPGSDDGPCHVQVLALDP